MLFWSNIIFAILIVYGMFTVGVIVVRIAYNHDFGLCKLFILLVGLLLGRVIGLVLVSACGWSSLLLVFVPFFHLKNLQLILFFLSSSNWKMFSVGLSCRCTILDCLVSFFRSFVLSICAGGTAAIFFNGVGVAKADNVALSDCREVVLYRTADERFRPGFINAQFGGNEHFRRVVGLSRFTSSEELGVMPSIRVVNKVVVVNDTRVVGNRELVIYKPMNHLVEVFDGSVDLVQSEQINVEQCSFLSDRLLLL